VLPKREMQRSNERCRDPTRALRPERERERERERIPCERERCKNTKQEILPRYRVLLKVLKCYSVLPDHSLYLSLSLSREAVIVF
jgi:hypothetical protein